MAIFEDNKILTFTDLISLISNEGFFEKNPISPSNKEVTKDELLFYLHTKENQELATWSGNRLIPKRLAIKEDTYWIGIDGTCVQDDIPQEDNPPTTPTIISQTITTSSIQVDWTANPGTDDNGIIGYKLYYIPTFLIGELPPVVIDVGLVTNYNISPLVSNTEFSIQVTAYDIVPQESILSNTLIASTLVNIDNIVGELYFIETTESSIQLGWNDPISVDGIVDYYKIEYKLDSSSTWTEIGTNISAASRSYTIQSLLLNSNYDCRIRFFTTDSEISNYSNIVRATTNTELIGYCNTEIEEGGQAASLIYNIAMTGTGSIFEVKFNPFRVPDRFRIYSGGNLLFDTGFIGQASSTRNYEQELLDSGVSSSNLNLDQYTNVGEGNFGIIENLDSSLIINNTVKLIVNAPLYSTRWLTTVGCIKNP